MRRPTCTSRGDGTKPGSTQDCRCFMARQVRGTICSKPPKRSRTALQQWVGPVLVNMAVLTPTTCPPELISGPPLLPGCTARPRPPQWQPHLRRLTCTGCCTARQTGQRGAHTNPRPYNPNEQEPHPRAQRSRSFASLAQSTALVYAQELGFRVGAGAASRRPHVDCRIRLDPAAWAHGDLSDRSAFPGRAVSSMAGSISAGAPNRRVGTEYS